MTTQKGEMKILSEVKIKGLEKASSFYAITFGYDALRLCLGQIPKNHTLEEVIRWIKRVNKKMKDPK